MKAQNFLNTEIVTDEKRFDVIINSKSFVDFKVIDEKYIQTLILLTKLDPNNLTPSRGRQ